MYIFEHNVFTYYISPFLHLYITNYLLFYRKYQYCTIHIKLNFYFLYSNNVSSIYTLVQLTHGHVNNIQINQSFHDLLGHHLIYAIRSNLLVYVIYSVVIIIIIIIGRFLSFVLQLKIYAIFTIINVITKYRKIFNNMKTM